MAALFAAGAMKAKITIGTWWKSGLELMLIGMAAAIAGYAIGHVLGVTI
jgi:VIT1/CCC1 family predicted Fe2+/Mn2+ transporter